MNRLRVAVVAIIAALGGVALSLATGSTGASGATGTLFRPSGWYMVFDFVRVGTESSPKSVIIHNDGGAPLTFATVSLTGPDAGDFHVTSDGCAGTTVAPGGSCTTSVKFVPTVTGTRVGAIMYTDTARCSYWVQLAGSGGSATRSATARSAGCATGSVVTVPGRTVQRTVTQFTPAQSHRILVLPPACHSRRHFRIHIVEPAGVHFTQVSVHLNGRTFRVVRGKRLTSFIDLRGLPRRRFTLLIRATTSDGRHVTAVRHYVTCVRK